MQLESRFDRWSQGLASVVPVRAIAAAEIVGGVYTILALGNPMIELYRRGELASAKAKFFYVVGTLYGLSVVAIIAGILLWRSHPRGALLSTFVQYAQLVQVQLPHFTFIYVLGAALGIEFTSNGGVEVFLNWSTHSRISVLPSTSVSTISVNLLAVAMLMVLVVFQDRLEGRT